jgi:hypothetical protein
LQIRDEISEGFFRAALATLQHRNDPVDPVVELLIQPPQYRMTLIGWYALGRILQETSSLNCLSIAECAISNQILMAIASAIFANSTLEMIDLTRLMQGGLPVPRVNETDPMLRARIETTGFPHVLWQISRSNMPPKKSHSEQIVTFKSVIWMTWSVLSNSTRQRWSLLTYLTAVSYQENHG